MANPQRRSSQRPSRDSSVSSHRGEDIFSDENEIDSFGIADGYRPTFALQEAPSSRKISHQSLAVQNTTSPPRDSKKKPLPSQQSSQPLISRNSFSLQHDAQYSDGPRRVYSISSPADQEDSPADVPATRPLSILSRQSTFARPQSTYNGPSAPSHPYGMYPQIASDPARRTSVASSHRPVRERSYLGADRPMHPYGMYPQNTVSDNDTDPLAGSADIASVGFPGLRQQFARRLGPNGDDADDIIGPDGHTEQLPPYTQYPDVGPATHKIRMASVPLSPIPQEPSQVANSATSIHDTLLSPITPTSMRDPILGPHRISLRARDRWTEKSKRKTCFGKMPLWLVIVIIFLMVALGAIGGGIIGHYLPSHKHGGDKSVPTSSQPEYGTNSSIPTLPPPPPPTPDPSPTGPPATPSNSTTLIGGANAAPTGTFTIVVSSEPQHSNSCLAKDEQKAAWDCTSSLQLNISVENPLNERATVTLTASPVVYMYYGEQNFSSTITAKVNRNRVEDIDNPDLGQAYYFSTRYDKQVILSDETDLDSSSSKRSEIQQINKRYQLQKRDYYPIKDNDMVWDCWWNNTFIDGFIYVNDASSYTASSSSQAATDHSKRHLYGRDLYSKKMKIREIRQDQTTLPQCTRMRYVNQQLVPSGQPPVSLDELPSPSLRSKVVSHWHQGWSNYKDKDDDDDDAPTSLVSFCDCVWMFG